MAKQKRLWYLAHPLSPEDGETIEGNLSSAKNYLRELNRAGLHVIAPWIGLCESLDDTVEDDRKRGMAADALMVGRCDGVILCGCRISSGMTKELLIARTKAKPVIECVGMSPQEAAVYIRMNRTGP